MSTLYHRSVTTRFVPVREWRDEHDLLHRHSGPAIESSTGSKYWWWHGKFLSRDSGEQPSLTEVFPKLPPAKVFPGYEEMSSAT